MMNYLKAFLALTLLSGLNFSFAQNCENIRFESGDFFFWNGFTGYCCGAGINNPGIVDGRHTIITEEKYLNHSIVTKHGTVFIKEDIYLQEHITMC